MCNIIVESIRNDRKLICFNDKTLSRFNRNYRVLTKVLGLLYAFFSFWLKLKFIKFFEFNPK